MRQSTNFWQYIEDGEVELIYIRTNENPADMFTKNLPTDKFEYHNLRVMDGVQNYLKEQKKFKLMEGVRGQTDRHTTNL
jgi:hypothetical protein